MLNLKISILLSFFVMAVCVSIPFQILPTSSPFTPSHLEKLFESPSLDKEQNQLGLNPLLHPERIYVGELQDRWKFPSDHLPIGIAIQDVNHTFRIVSWNVLNSAYMNWVYDNSQGLAQSDLTKDNIQIKENGFTLREQRVIDILLNMIYSSHFSSNILCLQECSEIFIQELELQIPSHMKIIRSSEMPVKNQNIVLYDPTQFEFVEKTLHIDVFASEPNRPLMEVILKNKEVRYRIFNAHLRCDFSKPQRVELAQFAYKRKQKEEVTIVLGDLNVDQMQMKKAFATVASQNESNTSFLPFTTYKTTISPEFYSKTIDHIFVDLGVNSLIIRENNPNELWEGLQNIVDLLNNKFG